MSCHRLCGVLKKLFWIATGSLPTTTNTSSSEVITISLLASTFLTIVNIVLANAFLQSTPSLYTVCSTQPISLGADVGNYQHLIIRHHHDFEAGFNLPLLFQYHYLQLIFTIALQPLCLEWGLPRNEGCERESYMLDLSPLGVLVTFGPSSNIQLHN